MKKKILLVNAIISLVIGAVAYYVFFPEVEFAKAIDAIWQTSFHIKPQMGSLTVRLLRFYSMDFLWANALMSLALLIWPKFGCPALVFAFEMFMELLQLFPGVKGTFDIWDIVVEIIANILVLLLFWRKRDEKG